MLRKILLINLVLMSFNTFSSDTISVLETPILNAINKGNITQLATAIFPEGSGMRKYFSLVDLQSLNKSFESTLNGLGDCQGFELLQESNINNIYIIRYFVFKFDRQPILVKFEYYKPNNDWRINGFKIDTDFDGRMAEGSMNSIRKLGSKDKS